MILRADLTGKTALVTGASSGLGRHFARVLARSGATDINREFRASPAGAAMLKRIPQRRLGELCDLDGPLLLLASEASRYITGAVLAVDGGHLVSTL